MAQTPATYRQLGDTLDHTPGSAVAAGQVILIGSTVVTIAVDAIAADTKGAISTRGVWNVPKDNSDVSAGDALYWDADGSPVGGTALSGAFTKTTSGNTFAGYALEAAGTGVGDVDMFLRSIDGTIPGTFVPFPIVGTVAAANSAQNNGAAITGGGLTLVTAADNTKAVVLPAAAAGDTLVLANFSGGNNTLAVFPAVGDAINALGANNVYTQATNATVMFIAYNAAQWYTI